MIDSTPGERFRSSPRPLLFIRIRLYRGGQAEFIRDLLRDEQANLYDDLAQKRADGKGEEDRDVIEITTNLRHLINALKDIDLGLIDLSGPDADPR